MAQIKASPITKKRQDKWELEINNIQKRLDYIPIMKQKIYDDYCGDILDESEYKHFNKQYDDEKQSLVSKLSYITAETAKLESDFVDNNPWLSAMERFINEKELTREMLLTMVERIKVSGNRTVEIKFKFADEYKRMLLQYLEESEAVLA